MSRLKIKLKPICLAKSGPYAVLMQQDALLYLGNFFISHTFIIIQLMIKSYYGILLFIGYGEDLVGRVSESIELECPHSTGKQIVYFLTGNTLWNEKK